MFKTFFDGPARETVDAWGVWPTVGQVHRRHPTCLIHLPEKCTLLYRPKQKNIQHMHKDKHWTWRTEVGGHAPKELFLLLIIVFYFDDLFQRALF